MAARPCGYRRALVPRACDARDARGDAKSRRKWLRRRAVPEYRSRSGRRRVPDGRLPGRRRTLGNRRRQPRRRRSLSGAASGRSGAAAHAGKAQRLRARRRIERLCTLSGGACRRGAGRGAAGGRDRGRPSRRPGRAQRRRAGAGRAAGAERARRGDLRTRPAERPRRHGRGAMGDRRGPSRRRGINPRPLPACAQAPARMSECDLLVVNADLVTMTGGPGCGELRDGALAASGSGIDWVGARKDLPSGLRARTELDAKGGWLTPGLIDCHTHLVYAGNRAREFEQRLRGASYEDIALEGGGILSTVRASRAASEEALVSAAAPRLSRLLEEGVATVEIKSGYGLDLANELKMLRAARRLGAESGIDVRTTLLAAH